MSDAQKPLEWGQFTAAIANQKQVVLVGPLFNKQHQAVRPTVYVDGGVRFRDHSPPDGVPTISVGDGDSAGVPLDHTLSTEKSFSDLAFVLGSLPAHVQHVELFGFLGGRKDHELLNYGEAHQFLSTATSLRSVRFDDVIVAFAGGPLTLELNGEFSVVVFEQSVITMTGACKYPFSNPTILKPASSLGLSNVGFGLVTFDCLKPCFVFIN